jgi:hypothetical protein
MHSPLESIIAFMYSPYFGPFLTLFICFCIVRAIQSNPIKGSNMDNSDSNAYFLAVCAGVVLCLGNLVAGEHDILGTHDYISSILTSGFLGYYFSHRAWRWPLALFFTQLVVHSIIKGEISNLLPIAIILFPVLALPAVAVATLSAWAYRRYH